MRSRCEVIIADDAEHEEVFAEMYFAGKFVAIVSQEPGRNRLMVEIPGPGLAETEVLRQIPYSDFVFLLKTAAKKLDAGN